jgi:hypothetical protein
MIFYIIKSSSPDTKKKKQIIHLTTIILRAPGTCNFFCWYAWEHAHMLVDPAS